MCKGSGDKVPAFGVAIRSERAVSPRATRTECALSVCFQNRTRRTSECVGGPGAKPPHSASRSEASERAVSPRASRTECALFAGLSQPDEAHE